jgi:hypothetical protein
MPVALTFTSLSTQVLQAYVERGGSATDPTFFGQIPLLINNAERALARRLKILGMVIPIVGSLAAGTAVYTKPNGWRRTVSMNFGVATVADSSQNSATPLFARQYEYCLSYWPDLTQTAQPQFYADVDYAHWLIVPTPQISYPWQILYYGLPQLLDSSNQTNFWTNFAPETLLYRALLECEPFLKNDERIPTWRQYYEEGATNLENEDLMRSVDRAAVRNED